MKGVMASLSGLVAVVLVLALGAFALPDRDRQMSISMVTELQQERDALANRRFHEILGDSPLVTQFAGFASKFNKAYESVLELHYRFGVFLESLQLIEETSKKNLPYKLGINKFADISFEEFRRHHLGVKQQNCSATRGTHKMRSSSSLPKKVDWRPSGIVSPVKDQASCGSCWTFSTTGALEAAHAQATGQMVILSEQQLVDCAGAFNNMGCGGGLPSQAFEYIKYIGGLDTEDSYPYHAVDEVCKYDASSVGAQVYDVVNITAFDEQELIDAVAFQRPVAIAYEVASDFRLYVGGVYTSTQCRQGPETVNHAVLAVGYDSTTGDVPFWIIKNSWGADWGEDGYFRMELGKNMCGIATCSSYPIVPESIGV